MTLQIKPSPLSGTAEAIASKTHLHRLLICCAASENSSEIYVNQLSEDVCATIRCLCALGADISYSDNTLYVNPISAFASSPLLDCGESGATLRFMLPLACALSDAPRFTGTGRLPQRPIGELIAALETGGVCFSRKTLPFSLTGRLRSGNFSLSGGVSSQHISGLLMTLPLLDGDSRLHLTSPLQSAPYVDVTLQTLMGFGAVIEPIEGGWAVSGGQRLSSPGKLRAEGDWSNAAFFLVSGAISGSVTVTGLSPDSRQGDREIVRILERFGARVTWSKGEVTVSHAPLHGCQINISDIPDLLPALAVLAAFSDGKTVFTGASRLRFKESDRLQSVSAMINSLGGEALAAEDSLTVCRRPLTGGHTDSFGDHRIAMAACVAAAHCPGEVTLEGAQAVNKSYPDFFKVFTALGGKADVI